MFKRKRHDWTPQEINELAADAQEMNASDVAMKWSLRLGKPITKHIVNYQLKINGRGKGRGGFKWTPDMIAEIMADARMNRHPAEIAAKFGKRQRRKITEDAMRTLISRHKNAAPVEVPPDPTKMQEIPDDEAPMREWLKPLSAKCESARSVQNSGKGYAFNPTALIARVRDKRQRQERQA